MGGDLRNGDNGDLSGSRSTTTLGRDPVELDDIDRVGGILPTAVIVPTSNRHTSCCALWKFGSCTVRQTLRIAVGYGYECAVSCQPLLFCQ